MNALVLDAMGVIYQAADVDDRQKNLEAALSLSMTAVLFGNSAAADYAGPTVLDFDCLRDISLSHA